MSNEINFGTDGWRGIIAEEFTFANVKKVAAAFSRYLKKRPLKKPFITVGYDTRFLSGDFAAAFCETLMESGVKTVISSEPITSPCLSFATFNEKADCGVMLTASHNPYYYSGIKFKSSKGSSLPKSETDLIEKLLPEKAVSTPEMKFEITNKDFSQNYLEKIKSLFKFEKKKLSKLKIAFNPMFGSAAGYLKRAVENLDGVIETNSHHNPMFGGKNPEPIGRFLGDFGDFVRKTKAEIGLAVDGDGDRIGVVDDNGVYIHPHIVFPIILEYLLGIKKLKGRVIQGFALGYLSKRVAKNYGTKLTEVPVGFKYVAEELMKNDCLIGAEESGGIGAGNFLDYIPERDGILASMIIIEILTETGQKFSSLVGNLQKKYGKSFYDRFDLGIEKIVEPSKIYEKFKKNFDCKFLKLKIRAIDELDGIKFIFENDSWLLIRASGTEPIARIYCESPDNNVKEQLIGCARKLIEKIIPPHP